MGKKKRIFIASSNDLADEREKFKTLLYDNDFEPILWEDIDHSITEEEFQDRINSHNLSTSDVVIFIIKSKLGEYTIEEFLVAYNNLGTQIQKIYVYFLNFTTNDMDREEQKKIWNLQDFLDKKEKKLYRKVDNYDQLENAFLKQIKHINEDILPIGIEEINEDKDEKLRYRRYLSKNELPYISRSEFKNKKLDKDSPFKTENDYFHSILDDSSSYDGVFISGEGGVGKTRLMYEIGRKAQSEGWVVYQIFPEFQGWDTLELNASKKYCFLFDYVEENIHFTDNIIDILGRRYNNISIKIIANARNTYFINNDTMGSLFNEINLDISNSDESNYLKYVILEIFKSKDIELDEEKLKSLTTYISKPSFAIFLLHGLLNGKGMDFSQIEGFSDFIKKRLALTFGKTSFVNIDSKAFYFIFSLPVKKEIVSEIDKFIFEKLEEDGWIEHDTKKDIYQSAYNDTIMDEVLISYLGRNNFRKNHILKEEFETMFNFSIEHSKFLHMFRALDRISNKIFDRYQEFSFIDIFIAYTPEIKNINNVFTKTSLLSKKEVLAFIQKYQISEPHSFSYSLALLNALKDITKDSSDYDSIMKLTQEWLMKYPSLYLFDFILHHYLSHDVDFVTIKASVEQWLNDKNNFNHESYTFIAKRYMNRINNLSEIYASIEAWLKKNINNEQFYFVVYPYLLKVQDIESAKLTIETWFNKNIEHKNFSFVILQYLLKVKDVEFVKNIILSWLKNNTERSRFPYVVVACLQKDISIDLMEDSVMKFIKNKKKWLYKINCPIKISLKENQNNKEKLQPLIDLIEKYKKTKET